MHAAQGFRTNCTNCYDWGGGNSTPLNYGLYGLYEILKRRARFVGRFVHGLYGLYEFLKRNAWFVGRLVDGWYGFYDRWEECALPQVKEVLWVHNHFAQFSAASPFFICFPLRGLCFPPIEGSPPRGGASANEVESPTPKSSLSDFVVPVVVPGA